MKLFKSIIPLAIFCIAAHMGFAQVPDWSLGGNLTNPGDYLGTNNAQNLDFRVNANPRMRLMQTGALGLGAFNFTPSAQLHANLLSFTSASGALQIRGTYHARRGSL